MDPNPQYYRISLADRIKGYTAELSWPFTALATVLRRKGRGKLSLSDELFITEFRT
jgi:hypothetical protein